MKILRFWKVIFLSFLVFALFSCGNHHSTTPKSNLIFHTTGSLITAKSSVEVTFKSTPELMRGLSEQERRAVFEIHPRVKGNVFLTSKKTMVFQPDQPLEYGKKYTIKIHLNKLFQHPDKPVYQFQVQVMMLQLDLRFENLEPYANTSSKLAKLSGNIIASDAVSTDQLKNAFSAEQNGNELPVSITPTDNNLVYHFVIDSLQRTDQQQIINVKLNGKEMGARRNQSWNYNIPPVNKFSMVQYNVVKTPALHLELVFSDNLLPGQNMDGLVYFKDGTTCKISAKGNEIKVYPDKKLGGSHALVISKDIKNTQSLSLNREYVIRPFFEMAPPQVRFIGNGNILPGNKQWIVPFEAVNLSAVDVVVFKIYANNIKQFLQENSLSDDGDAMNRVGEFIYHKKIILEKDAREPDNKWKSYAIDLTKMIQAEPGAIYRIGFRFRKSYAILDCQNDTSQATGSGAQIDTTDYYYSDYYYPPNYSWSNRNSPCDNSYYNYEHFSNKNFVAGNIGLTLLGYGDDQYEVFARNLLTVDPMNAVKIQFFSFQNQKLGEVTTDENGKAKINLKKQPFLVIARKGNQYAYLRLKGGSALSYSKFETNGVKADNGLKGYIFGERGVWRPGDTLFLTFVLQDKQKMLPAGFPVRMEVRDSRDHQVFTESLNHGVNGFYVFKVPTSQNAPTGIWRAVVQLGNYRFKKNLRVETILPNRLKIKFQAASGRFTTGGSKYLNINSVWLHGGLASGLKANVTESIYPKKVKFSDYQDYTFNDPSKSYYPEEQTVFDDKLDSLGGAQFKVELPQGKNLPGMLNLTFVAKVFEPGGRFSIDQKKYEYAPFDCFIGLKKPELGSEPYLETDHPQQFSVVTLDKNGKPISMNNLSVEVYRLDWSWWYNSNQSNLGSYVSQHYDQKVLSKTINTQDGKGQFSFEIKYPNWGDYFVKVTDKKSGYSAGTIVYFDWPSSYSRSDRKQPGDATLLSLSTDKKSYRPGDMVHLSFPTAANAKALISIQKNNQIVKSWWVNTSEKQTVVNIPITKDMTPNVYVFVSVIQPHLQTENDLPIRSYGVVPIMVNDPATELKPILTVPDKTKPDSKYRVSVKEANGKKMTYVLAVVDEGLLDLTHFRTPSLHDYFYKKEALAVNAWDFYNDVNGAYGGRLLHVFAIGGGQDKVEMGTKKVIRFKPVVTFLGPFTLPEGSAGQTHTIKMPDYVGSVRVMVVAGNKGAYGSTDKTVPVKQALMVLASLPRTLVPGETLHLPVTIFAMEKGIKKVKLSIKTNDMLSVETPEQTVSFSHMGDKIAYVNMKVAGREGVGTAHLEVTSGKHKAVYNVKINIRNPNQRTYHSQTLAIEKGKSILQTPDFMPHATGHQLEISVSEIPSLNLQNRMQYLISYPYGCVEQTVSSVFPQLFLEKFTSLSANQKSQIEQNVNNAIVRLGSFQRASGAMSYWPGEQWVSNWGTDYAGQFLLMAKDAGYYVPADMLNSWLSYQMNAAAQWTVNNTDYSNDAYVQAYRLYTLALAGEPNLSVMNRMREMKDLSPQVALRLAAAYALIGQKTAANKLLRGVSWSQSSNPDSWRYTFGSEVRDEAMALETYVLLGDKATAFQIFKKISKSLGSDDWMSTQTTAFALYAAAKFVGNNDQNQAFKFSYVYNGRHHEVASDKPVSKLKLEPGKDKKLEVNNESGRMLFLSINSSAVPLPGEKVNEHNGIQLSVQYYDMKGHPLQERSLPQGKDFYVKIKVKNSTLTTYHHLALTALFPSGWEILNTRMTDLGKAFESSPVNYVDIRDDRVNLFFDLYRSNTKTFYILLNAAYPGVYFRPPITCQAMYNHEIQAALGGGTVRVILSK